FAGWAARLPVLGRCERVKPPPLSGRFLGPDGKVILMQRGDRWERRDARTGAPSDHPGAANHPFWLVSDDGARGLVLAEGRVTVIDLAAGRPAGPELAAPQSDLWEFGPGGETVSARVHDPARDATAVRVWDVKTGRVLVAAAAGTHDLYHLTRARDGREVLVVFGEARARAWDVRAGRELPALPDDDPAVGPDGRALISANSNGVVGRWDRSTGEPLPPLARLP